MSTTANTALITDRIQYTNINKKCNTISILAIVLLCSVLLYTIKHITSNNVTVQTIAILTQQHNKANNQHITNFLLLSDIHIDLYYDAAYHNTTYNICRRPNHIFNCTGAQVYDNNIHIHKYNAQYLCDPSTNYINTVLTNLQHTLKHTKIDFILITGDIVAHFTPCRTDTLEAYNIILSQLYHVFNNVTIIPSTGNTDWFPTNTMSHNDNQLYRYSRLFSRYNILQDNEQYEQFKQYGRYVYNIHNSNLSIIVLNTMPYSPQYINATDNKQQFTYCNADIIDYDPLYQFEWLEQQLYNAKQYNKTVYIIGHIPRMYSYMLYNL